MKGDLSLVIIGYLVGIIVLAGIIYYASNMGKAQAANATSNATPAPGGEFPQISPTNVFALPTTTTTPEPTAAPTEYCADGTAENECNGNLTLCTRVDGALALIEDCEECGCGQGQRCNPDTLKCFNGCEDGTLLLQCSNATPDYYCNANASLEINGFECGCPLGYQYDPYGSGPNSLNGCTSTCRTGPDCQLGK